MALACETHEEIRSHITYLPSPGIDSESLNEPYCGPFQDRRIDKFRAWTDTRDVVLLPIRIFEKMPTAAKVMLLAMFHRRDGFRSFGIIHLMSYTIASAATTVPDD